MPRRIGCFHAGWPELRSMALTVTSPLAASAISAESSERPSRDGRPTSSGRLGSALARGVGDANDRVVIALDVDAVVVGEDAGDAAAFGARPCRRATLRWRACRRRRRPARCRRRGDRARASCRRAPKAMSCTVSPPMRDGADELAVLVARGCAGSPGRRRRAGRSARRRRPSAPPGFDSGSRRRPNSAAPLP